MTLDELKRRFRIVPTLLIGLPRDLSKTPVGQPVTGDCQDFARTVRKIMKVKPWQAVVWRCWSPQNGLLPRHAVIWVKGHGWIDSTDREWRSSPKPHRRAWPVGAPALAVIAALFGASPMRADIAPSRMTLEGPTDACFAVVVVENRVGVYIRDETLETDHGAVVVHYQTVGGHNAIDADLIEVLALPDGVAADPMRMALPDGDTGRICLMEWIGG